MWHKLLTMLYVLLFPILLSVVVGQTVNILNCAGKAVSKRISHPFVIKPDWTSEEEKQLVLKYNWTYTLTGFNGEKINIDDWLEPMSRDTFELIIPPYSLTPSQEKKYTVTVRSKRKPNVKDGPNSLLPKGFTKCNIGIIPYYPIAVISGGYERQVPPNDDIFISGEESFDPNFVPVRHDTVIYQWICHHKVAICAKKPFSTEPKFTFPGEYLAPGDVFTIEMKLKLNYTEFYYNNEVITIQKNQTIVVKKLTAVLELSCRKNCVPVTHFPQYTEETLYGISCIEHCKGLNSDDYEWKVRYFDKKNTLNYDYTKGRFGRKGRVFQIPGKMLELKVAYIVSVKLKGSTGIQGYASDRIIFHGEIPDVKDCVFIPDNGKTFTDFQFTCTQNPPGQSIFYRVYAINKNDNNKRLIVSGYFPDVMSKKFKLPASKSWNYIVKADEKDTPTAEVPITANVASSLADKSSDEVIETIDTIYSGDAEKPSIPEKIASKNREIKHEGMETLQTVADALQDVVLENEKVKEFIEDMKTKVGADILNISITTLNDVKILSDSLVEIQELNEEQKSDPLMQKITSTICKKLADTALSILQKESFPIDRQAEVKQITKSMARCVESNSKPNLEIIDPIILNITTPAPIFDVPLLEEHYENYEDFDEKYYKNIDNLREAAYNTINVSMSATKMTALTTAIGEGEIKTLSKHSESIVAKNFGDELYSLTLRVEGVAVNPSKDFEDDSHSYDILVVSFKQDIFWWNPKSVKTVTNIIVSECWHSSCKERVSTFEHPFDFYLDLKKDFHFDEYYTKYSLTVTHDYSSLSQFNINYEIRAHRIFLTPGQNLHVHFRNLKQTDVLDVVMTENKFPTIEDFVRSTTMTFNHKPPLMIVNRSDYPIFVFVGILVNKAVAFAGKTVTYEISSIVRFCMKWMHINSSWVPACRSGTFENQSIIHCQCREVTILAGYIQNIPSPPQEVTKAILELELRSCNTIFIALAVTLAVFHFLLLWILKEKESPVYFLGDNESRHLFAYVIVVKTGFCFRSGTTSNITIRLTGDKRISDPHVLNYPDPELRMLQQYGNDRFLLTSESHLGDIKEIELWSDVVGPSPSWYCRDVTVYDMQLQKEWYFNVQKTLSVGNSSPYVIVKQTSSDENEVECTNPEPNRKPIRKKIILFQLLYKRFHIPKFFFQKFAFYNFLCGRFFPGLRFRASFNKLKSPVINLTVSKFKKFRSFLHSLSFSFTYHTWSIWQHERNFPHAQKLGVMLSTVLTTFLVVMVALGIPILELSDGFDKYDLKIDKQELGLIAFTASFFIFLVHFIVAWCFRLRYTLGLQRRSFIIPTACNLACCTTITISVVVSTTILIVYGFWVPFTNSVVWLYTSLAALICGVFIHENLFLFIQNNLFIFRHLENFRNQFYTIWNSVEFQRTFLYPVFGRYLLRPYFTHLYQPLSKKNIKKKTSFLAHRSQVISDFQDLAMFAVYLIILFVVIWVDKDSKIVLGKIEMVRMMEGLHTRSKRFRKCSSIDDLHLYVNQTLIPTMQPMYWYDKYVISNPAIMVNMVDKFLGVVRLRQHRLERNLCDVPDAMAFLNVSCDPEFSLAHAETKPFGYRWEEYSPYVKFDRMASIWTFTGQSQTRTFPAFGALATYSGGGYIAYLGRTLYNSFLNFRKIYTHFWVNDKTRAVFIEFLSYNVDYNLFNSVVLRFEQSASGYVINDIKVYPARMLFVGNEMHKMSFAFFVLFIVWVSMLLLKQSLGILKNIRQFYKDVWMLVDTIIVFISVTVIICTVVREHFVGKYLDELEKKKHNEFLTYAHLFYMENILTLVGALLVCVSTVRLWKFLRFALLFRILERTLSRTAVKLSITIGCFCIILIGTAMSLVWLIGAEFKRLHSVVKTTRLLLLMALNSTKMKLAEYLPYREVLFILITYTVAMKVFTCLIISNILSSYFDAQLEFSNELDVYNIKHFILEKMAYFPKYMKYKNRRLCGGESKKNKVTPKSHKFLYSTSLSLPTKKMNIMKFIVQRLVKNRKEVKELSKSDVILMAAISEFYLNKRKFDEVDVFYKGREVGRKIRLIPENNIEKIANCVNLMLSDNTWELFAKVKISKAEKRCVEEVATTEKCLKTCNLRLKLLVFKVEKAEEIATRVFV